MRNVRVIARRELLSYFNSPTAYIVLVTFLLVAGWMFFSPLFLIGRADMRMFFQPSPFSPSMLLVILAPAVTMRLIAEERKSKTLELLTTMPITDAEVVLGKFLGAFVLLMAAVLVTVVYAVTVSAMGTLDWGPVIGGYVGTVLFCGAVLAIGLWASTLTDNQVTAFIVSFLICASLYFVYWLRELVGGFVGDIGEVVSLSYHLENLARGVIDTRDVLYYLTLTTGGLFLATRSLARQHA